MGELDAELDRGHPGARPVDDRLDGGFVVVAVEAEAALGDAAVALDVGRLEAEQAGARHRQHAVVDLVPGLGAAVDRRVLAHRRDDDAIGERHAAELDGREELDGHVNLVIPSEAARRAAQPRDLSCRCSDKTGPSTPPRCARLRSG
jgi:hypothetical protein